MWHDVKTFVKQKWQKPGKACITGLKANNRLQNMDNTENWG